MTGLGVCGGQSHTLWLMNNPQYVHVGGLLLIPRWQGKGQNRHFLSAPHTYTWKKAAAGVA